MQNTIKLFDRFPTIFPTAFEDSFLSGSFFDEFDKVFNSPKLKQMSVYPTDIYTRLDNDGKPFETIIEIAVAGIKKEDCSVELDNNVLVVSIGKIANPKTDETSDEDVIGIEKRDYIQKQIATRTTIMRWTLGNRINKEQIAVQSKDGILKISLPYLEKTETKHSIVIQ
jgi:HSP20 family protein